MTPINVKPAGLSSCTPHASAGVTIAAENVSLNPSSMATSAPTPSVPDPAPYAAVSREHITHDVTIATPGYQGSPAVMTDKHLWRPTLRVNARITKPNAVVPKASPDEVFIDGSLTKNLRGIQKIGLEVLTALSPIIETEADLDRALQEMKPYSKNILSLICQVKQAIHRIDDLPNVLRALSSLSSEQSSPLKFVAPFIDSAQDITRYSEIVRALERALALNEDGTGREIALEGIIARVGRERFISVVFCDAIRFEVRFLNALADLSHLIDSESDLRTVVSLANPLSPEIRARMWCLKKYIHSMSALKSWCTSLKWMEALIGEKATCAYLFNERDHPATIEQLKRWGVSNMPIAKIVATIGIEGLLDMMQRIGNGSRGAVFSYLPYVAHIVRDRTTLSETIDALGQLAEQGVLFAMGAIGSLIRSPAEIVSYGAAAQVIREANAHPTIPDCSNLCEGLSDWEELARAIAQYEQQDKEGELLSSIYFGSVEEGQKNLARSALLKGVRENGNILKVALEDEYADPRLATDRFLVFAALRRTSNAYDCVSPELQSDLSFRRRASRINFNVGAKMKDDIEQEMWRRYTSIKKRLEALNITFPLRFNTTTALEVIRNRHHLDTPDPRPIALMIYAKVDPNGSFEYNQIQFLMKHGYRVLYFEAGTKDDIKKIKADLNKIPRIVGRIPLMILGAHSSIFGSDFGTNDGSGEDVDFYLSVFTPRKGISAELAGMDKYLFARSSVIMNGCGVGGGREKVRNVANMLREFFPRSRIMAPTIPSQERYYEFDSKGRVRAVRYSTDGIEYVAEPLRPVVPRPSR